MNAKDIKAALFKRYGTNSSTAIAFEVAHGTGRHANRHVDAVVMDLWPSRGLTLHAMEIKCSMSDLKRELANGQKSEEIAQHCDFFSIVAPAGMVKKMPLPHAWGLIEIRSDGAFTFPVPAKQTKARVVDRAFMAAFARAIARPDTKAQVDKMLETERAAIEEQIKRRVESELTRRNEHGNLWLQLEDELKKIPGHDNRHWYTSREIIEAVALVVRTRLLSPFDSVEKLSATLKETSERLSTVLTEIKGETK